MRNAARHAHEVTGLGLHPDAIELEVEHAFLHQDELVLGRVDMHRHELPGLAVGLESEGGIGHGLGEVDLTQDVPGLALETLAVARDAFLECRHDVSLRLNRGGSIGRPERPVYPINESASRRHAGKMCGATQRTAWADCLIFARASRLPAAKTVISLK